jgi:uncharacterized membrane protein YdbT with pleckstrin-like domain
VYALVKSAVLELFRAPATPPDAPSGSHAHVQVMRAAPSYLRYRLVGLAILAGFAALGALGSLIAGIFAPPLLIVTGVIVLVLFPLLLVAYFAVRVDYDLRYYVITDRSVRVREGAWTVEEKTVTFANVQNVRLEQGPLERLFGVSNVRIDTAGGGMVGGGQHAVAVSHGVQLAGLDNAAQIRDLILARTRTQADAGLGDHDQARVAAAANWSPEHVSALRELAAAAHALRVAAHGRAHGVG